MSTAASARAAGSTSVRARSLASAWGVRPSLRSSSACWVSAKTWAYKSRPARNACGSATSGDRAWASAARFHMATRGCWPKA
uniref:Uncharacterized protein n=1 Tax=Tanacetum cinerariifolium TaxID=118510 RepID=A0A699UQD0_TANCI|nr:hypothetical protein [Tanacetum cinerariifolium]